MAKGIRAAVLRYGAALVAFALVLGAAVGVEHAFGLKFDPTSLIIILMIASAWYLGLGPGLLVAVVFELAIDYFTRPPFAFKSALVIFNRTVLLLSVVWFASSRRHAEQKLRAQREWLQVALSGIGDAVIATDIEGAVNFINPTATVLTGWDAARATGQPLAEVFKLISEETRAPVDSPLTMIKRTGSTVGLSNHTTLVTRDGREIPIENSGAPLKDAAGGIIGAIIVFHDVSERRRAELERGRLLALEQAARGEAEAANRLKDEFLATVSHELRTPLTAILGWATMINRDDKLSAQTVRDALAVIERNAKAQTQIVDDILDVSRIITGKLHIESRPVELTHVIQAAVDTLSPAANAKAIKLTTALEPHAGLVLGDANRLQQIIWNLVANAIKFTPAQGSVEVRLARVGADLELRVQDSGMGISQQFLPHVFERFRQADSSSTRAHGGLGLGLAIVRHLVELHGGRVTVASDGAGQGSVFTVCLPAAGRDLPASVATTAASIGPANAPADNVTARPDLTALRILVVDDEPDTLEVLRAGLHQYGANVYAASSSAAALAAFGQWQPNVLISDLGMPDEDGFALIGKIRALTPEQGGDIPAAALTAYVREEDSARALAAGYQAHIPKPIDPAMLATLVARLAKRATA